MPADGAGRFEFDDLVQVLDGLAYVLECLDRERQWLAKDESSLPRSETFSISMLETNNRREFTATSSPARRGSLRSVEIEVERVTYNSPFEIVLVITALAGSVAVLVGRIMSLVNSYADFRIKMAQERNIDAETAQIEAATEEIKARMAAQASKGMSGGAYLQDAFVRRAQAIDRRQQALDRIFEATADYVAEFVNLKRVDVENRRLKNSAQALQAIAEIEQIVD